MTPTFLLLLLTASFVPVPGSVRAAPAEEIPELEGLVERWDEAREALRVPGLAVVVVRDGEVVLLEGLGVRDVERGTPVTPSTAFYIASCTKTYVALRVVALAEEGRVDLDAPVVDYLPWMELADVEANETLTVRDLLSHAKGLNCPPCVFLDAYTGEITDERYFRLLRRFAPAGRPAYTNVHFTLLGRVIEAVTGEAWRDDLAANLFEPAGMADTTGYADEMYARDDVAFPSRWDGERHVYELRKTDRTMHAAGGLGTSARDLGRYLRLMLAFGSIDGTKIASPAAIEEMLELHARSSRRESPHRVLHGFGLGWMLGEFDGLPLAQHGGGYAGAAALVTFLPEHGVGVGVLANASGTGHALCDLVTDDVLARFTGQALHDWRPDVERILARAAEGTSTPSEDTPPTRATLSLAPEAYAGRYTNELWGTFVIGREDGAWSVRLGDLDLPIASTGVDTFRLGGAVGERGRFVVADGEVRALVAELDLGDTEVRFERE